MKSNEPDEPTNLTDRQIFYVLSHGQKRQAEIVRLLSTTRFSEKNIRKRSRKLTENNHWAAEAKKDGDTFYYRKNIGRQPTLEKPAADYSDIEDLLLDIEIKLGIKSREDLPTSNRKSPSLHRIFNNFLREVDENGQILNTDGHLRRYFNCVDKMLIQTEKGFSPEGPPPNYPIKTYGYFYTALAEQHESWKRGQAHEEFDKYLQKRLSEISELLGCVPTEIASQIMQILALIDIKKAREGFKKMVCSNEHRLKILIEHAEICYVYSNESNKLVEEMNIWKGNVDNIEVINKIEEIKKSVRDKVDD